MCPTCHNSQNKSLKRGGGSQDKECKTMTGWSTLLIG